MAFAAGLAKAEQSAFEREQCLAGLVNFFRDVYPDLCEEVARLPQIIKRELTPTLCSVFPEADINNIDRMFDAMDIDHDGEISIKELVDGLAKQGIKDVGRIAQMFKDADADGNGKIEWTEFLDFTRVMRGGEKKKKTMCNSKKPIRCVTVFSVL